MLTAWSGCFPDFSFHLNPFSIALSLFFPFGSLRSIHRVYLIVCVFECGERTVGRRGRAAAAAAESRSRRYRGRPSPTLCCARSPSAENQPRQMQTSSDYLHKHKHSTYAKSMKGRVKGTTKRHNAQVCFYNSMLLNLLCRNSFDSLNIENILLSCSCAVTNFVQLQLKRAFGRRRRRN
jgi:hypothetical protein